MQSRLFEEYQKEVKEIVDRIIKEYQPEKIIAFGSTASGRIREDSDIDLLVVKDSKKPFWQRVKDLLKLYEGFRSFDVSVLTPKEVEEASKRNWFFITEEILGKGKLLYEQK